MNLKTITVALLVSAQALVFANPTYLTSQEKYDSCFSSSKPMVTMYTSPSCGPCRQMKPDFYKASQSNPDLSFHLVEINKSEMKNIVQKLQIQAIPTIIFSCDGEVIARTRGGLSKKELAKEIAQFKDTLAKRAEKKASDAKKASQEAAQKAEPSKATKSAKAPVAPARPAKK